MQERVEAQDTLLHLFLLEFLEHPASGAVPCASVANVDGAGVRVAPRPVQRLEDDQQCRAFGFCGHILIVDPERIGEEPGGRESCRHNRQLDGEGVGGIGVGAHHATPPWRAAMISTRRSRLTVVRVARVARLLVCG